MGDKFNLDYQYMLYLDLMGLDIDKMPEDQQRETKRAYIGAIGQSLVLFKDLLGETEEERLNQIQHMEGQVIQFFDAEIKKDESNEATQQTDKGKPEDKGNIKSASIIIKLHDKQSGYRSTEKGMVSPNQYGEICKILQKK